MDEAMKRLLEQMAASVKALNETIDAKFKAPAANAEADVLVKRIQEMEQQMKALQTAKAIRKMAWFVEGKTLGEGVQGVTFGDFLKAVLKKDEGFFKDMGIVKTANGQSEGVNADGLYTVPTEYATEIVKLERANSIARRIGRIFPMGSKTRLVPSQLTQPTVTWTDEATNHTKTKITFSQLTQTAKKLSALIPMTEELLSDNNVNLDAFIFQVVAEAIGREEDRVAFAGNADPFNGVLHASGVNSVSMAGATLDWRDIVTQYMSIRAPYRADAKFVLGTSALALVMKLRDDRNQPIWTMPALGAPGTILGKAYEETDGSAMDLIVEFGPWGRHLWISDNGTYEVKASDSASDANGGAGSAFLQDEIWYKFRRRTNIIVANPEAFAKMTVAGA
jgi:HK97 family phage major capsid protein